MIDLGTVKPGSTVRIPFSTFKGSDGSSLTMSNYVAADILIYKDGSTTERASTSGFTATTDFDAKTGKQLAVIDLSDNTTADFFKAGSEYLVAVDAVTVDGVTTGGWIGRFRIGYQGAVNDTSIATLASQTSFTLTAGSVNDNAYVGCVCLIHAKASGIQVAMSTISAYTGSTKTVTLAVDPAIFTMAVGDNISIFPRENIYSLGGTVQTARDIGLAVPAVAAGASGGLLISGSNAGTTTLAALTVTGALTISDGIAVTRSTSNSAAVAFTGNGTGPGLVCTSGGGATGDGIQATSVATNGNGFVITGKGTGNGLKLVSVSGDAFLTVVSTSGHGATFAGTGTTKHGINATGGATTSHGISATGGGVGHGILATSGGGATGDGIKAVAASTNGNGLNLVGVGTGAGQLTTGGATGNGLQCVGGGTSGDAILTSATSGHGATFAGAGTTKHGINAKGGTTTSAGIAATGGATSGDGILVATTSGHGMNIAATGASKHGILLTGGNSGTSDGLKLVAGTGGVGFRLDTLTASGAITFSTTVDVTGAFTASNASNNIVGIDIAKIAGSATAATNAKNGWAGLIADTGTAQAGASTTITLQAGAVATNDYYTGSAIATTGGTGAGQVRKISSYVGSTKVATVDTAWAVNPDNTTTYQVLGRIV